MDKFIDIEENGVYLKIRVTADGDVRLLHFGAAPCSAACRLDVTLPERYMARLFVVEW